MTARLARMTSLRAMTNDVMAQGAVIEAEGKVIRHLS
jgi:hypothetical protein